MSQNKKSTIYLLFEQLQKFDIVSDKTEKIKTLINMPIDKFYQLQKQAEIMYEEEIRIAYEEGKEIGQIEILAERSTENASTYSEGYTQGYKRALEYMTDIIKNKIKTKENEQR